MSVNEQNPEMFDQWLTSSLKTGQHTTPAFEQSISKKIEHIKARQLLNRIVFQEKLAKIALILTVICGLIIIINVPILNKTYSIIESAFTSLIYNILNPSQSILAIFTLVIFVLCLLFKCLWDKIAAEI